MGFNRLYKKFEKAYCTRDSCTGTVKTVNNRSRKGGGGRKYKYDLRDRLIMTLFWMKINPTHSVIGEMWGLSRVNVTKTLMDISATLCNFPGFRRYYGQETRQRLHSVHEVLEIFPEIRLLQEREEELI